jgi:hypothetical protein
MTALMWDQIALMVEVSGGGTPRRGQRDRPESRAIIACKFTSYSMTPRACSLALAREEVFPHPTSQLCGGHHTWHLSMHLPQRASFISSYIGPRP